MRANTDVVAVVRKCADWHFEMLLTSIGNARTSTASAATKLGRSPANSTGLTMSSITGKLDHFMVTLLRCAK